MSKNTALDNVSRASAAARTHLRLNEEYLKPTDLSWRLPLSRTMVAARHSPVLPEGLMAEFIASASRDPTMKQALLEGAGEDLLEGRPLPAELARYIGAHLVEMAKQPMRSATRGRPLLVNWYRDRCIAVAVLAAVEEGHISAKRNRASRDANKALSACAVVTSVLRELGVNLSEDAVEKIWERYKDR